MVTMNQCTLSCNKFSVVVCASIVVLIRFWCLGISVSAMKNESKQSSAAECFPMPRGKEARHLSKYIFIITQDQGNDIVQKCTPRRLLQLMGWNKQKARDREQLTANTSHRLKQSKEYYTGVTISTDETDISTQSKTAKNKRPTTTHHSNRAHLSA